MEVEGRSSIIDICAHARACWHISETLNNFKQPGWLSWRAARTGSACSLAARLFGCARGITSGFCPCLGPGNLSLGQLGQLGQRVQLGCLCSRL